MVLGYGRVPTANVRCLIACFITMNFINVLYTYHEMIASATLRVYGKSAHLHLKFAQNVTVKLAAEFCNL